MLNENDIYESYIKLNLKAMILLKPEGKKFLCIAPHPDDEVIGCGGTIAKQIEYGDNVEIIYIFCDEELRHIELKEGLEELGVKKYSCLDKCATIDDKIEIIASFIAEKQPDGIYVPHIYDRHYEHFVANYILVQALQRNNTFTKIIMYEVWSTLIPTHIINITDYFEVKIRALNKHKSQVDKYDYESMVDCLNKYRNLSNHPNLLTRSIVKHEIEHLRKKGVKPKIPWTKLEAFRIMNSNQYIKHFMKLFMEI